MTDGVRWARLEVRRLRHRQRHIAVRVGMLSAGVMITLFSLALIAVFPELGLPGVLVGLGALALEFDWAARTHVRCQHWLDRIRAWFARRPTKVKVAMFVTPLVTMTITCLFLLPFSPF
jgi:hypothetical protein